MKQSERVRRGRHIITTIETHRNHVAEFHEIDNLDSKPREEAQNNYEDTFITIRTAMEQNEQFCCDNEEDRLSITQIIVDTLKLNGLIRKDS